MSLSKPIKVAQFGLGPIGIFPTGHATGMEPRPKWRSGASSAFLANLLCRGDQRQRIWRPVLAHFRYHGS